ncbi:MAG TPA: hypothetical protein VIJ27_10240 [Mucilaginibacter sp.]
MALREFTGELVKLHDDFLNKRIHIICPAANGLTVFNAFVVYPAGMSHDKAGQLAETVNIKNETGTLYPMFNMTIIPLTLFKNRNDFGNEVIMKKHIADCFEAHKTYIKSPKMIFVFEKKDDFDYQLATKVLLNNWGTTDIDVEYLAS